MLCFSSRFYISGIAFCKRGVIFPCLQKQYFLSLAILSSGKLLFILWVYCSFFVFPLLVPPLLPLLFSLAIGKNLQSKSVFLFVLRYFLLIAQTQRIKRIQSPKREIKKFLLLFLSFIFYLSFTGRRLNHKRQQNHEKVRK